MELNFTRRLQSINGCAFISLPKAWARAHGLGKGDRMCVSLLDDGSLKISPLEVV
jgi:phosphate uptake regulator